MKNHYIALLNAAGSPVVSLPSPLKVSYSISVAGVVSGLSGAQAMWNGSLDKDAHWCCCAVEVLSQRPWDEVEDSEKRIIWSRKKGSR